MKLGNWELPAYAMLAPMAGVSDRALRELCMRYGAVACVGEMVSSKGLVQGSRKSAELLEIGEREMPCAIQLFGEEPEPMARAAELAQQYHPAWLDINMGCPAPKIAGNRSGSALMLDPERASAIIRAVKAASSVPVTVKFRKGWDEEHQNYLDFAKMAEDAGAAAITLHGRTRTQMYAGKADWEAIARVKQAVSIPVIANGDVDSPEKAMELLRETGADAVMIGRGALGNPWLFTQCNAMENGQEIPPLPPLSQRMETVRRQITLAAEHKGEHIAMLQARKHFAWYLKGVRGTKKLKACVSELNSFAELDRLLEQAAKLEG